jgi:hypothetical protein
LWLRVEISHLGDVRRCSEPEQWLQPVGRYGPVLCSDRDREKTMPSRFDDLKVANGELVPAKDMPDALTAATLHFGDGATQVFTADGQTTYVEQGRSSQGEWSVIDDGEFSSFWPPSYRATYALRWIVEEGAVTGLSFIHEETGDRFDGRYG